MNMRLKVNTDACPLCGGQGEHASVCSLAAKPRLQVVYERVMARTEKITESGCWIFMGGLNRGHGHVYVGQGGGYGLGRWTGAHRITYLQERGPIPPGLTLDHLCRGRCCVNPFHLEAVTQGENVLRGESRPAKQAALSECPRCGGPYTFMYGSRRCPPCHKAVKRAYDKVRVRDRRKHRSSQEVA